MLSVCFTVPLEVGSGGQFSPSGDPTIRQPGFDLPRQQLSPLNHFRMEQGHCGACRRKWRVTDNDLCSCGKTQMMSHIVESCPLTKLNGGLSRLHSADEGAVSWLTSYGSWNAYEKKMKTVPLICGFRRKDPCIGDVMRKFAPFLKLYSEYVKNFDTAMDTITYWMDKCPRFLDVIKTIQVRSVSCTVTFWLW